MSGEQGFESRELRALVAQASGALKVFPLPGVVVLPGTPTPFHVFEPRYRAMIADALDGDRTLAIATLRRSEEQPQDRPALHSAAGAGVIEADEKLPDGRYRILFRCLERVRLLEELPNGKPYREFRTELLEDRYPPGGEAALQGSVEALEQLVYDLAKVLPAESGAPRLAEAAARMRNPSRLADLVGAAVASEPAARLELLETLDVGKRLELVMQEVASVLLVLSRGRAPRA
jgi:Lon protease-like protein